jgi:hypothetical protein
MWSKTLCECNDAPNIISATLVIEAGLDLVGKLLEDVQTQVGRDQVVEVMYAHKWSLGR